MVCYHLVDFTWVHYRNVKYSSSLQMSFNGLLDGILHYDGDPENKMLLRDEDK